MPCMLRIYWPGARIQPSAFVNNPSLEPLPNDRSVQAPFSFSTYAAAAARSADITVRAHKGMPWVGAHFYNTVEKTFGDLL